MKRVAILQSNYIPWKGYFDIIASVDEFIIYDCVQYTKQDWRNRNQIKAPHGKIWLTVPVRRRALNAAIDEIEVASQDCFSKHWKSFCQSYSKAPWLGYCREAFEDIFIGGARSYMLSEENVRLIRLICGLLGVRTPIRDSREFSLVDDRNERLLDICLQAEATHYLSGAAAKSYLDEDRFNKAGITVEWMKYEGYPEYQQPHPPFDHYVSILDLLACVGPGASKYMLHTGERG